MSGDPGDLIRRQNRIKVAAMIVPIGVTPDPAMRAMISQPIRLRVRIQKRKGGGQDNASDQSKAQPDLQRQPTAAASGSAGDPNIPVGPTGVGSMAPRRLPRQSQAQPTRVPSEPSRDPAAETAPEPSADGGTS